LQFGDQYECSRLVAGDSSFELDYSVLEIAGQPETLWGLLPLGSASDPMAGEDLFIVQHPAGEAKQISKINCKAGLVPVDGRATGSDFIHSCDTAGGSSGSPVTDSAGNLVGLHHYGFNEGGAWSQNRAVRIRKIVDHMQE
jgi:V8-like Glu-specific endopeptidase